MRELKGDWRDLFGGFMVALDLRKMFLGFCGLTLSMILGITLTVGTANLQIPGKVKLPNKSLVLHEWWEVQTQSWQIIYSGVPSEFDPLARLGGNPGYYIPYSIIFVLSMVLIWAYFGGAIARIAAYEIAKDGERIETRKALHFARVKFSQFFWAPVICVLGLIFFGLCCYIGGFIGGLLNYVYIGAPLVAILLPLALLAGFIMVLIAVGTVTGLPLFLPAVAAEGTDSFDAVSRGFSYVYSRPWHYIFYQFVTWIYGYVCIGFVILFAVTMSHWGITTGAAGFKLCGAMNVEAEANFNNTSDGSWRLFLSDRHTHMSNYDWDPVSLVTEPHPYGRLQTLANQIVHPETTSAERTDHKIASFLVTCWLALVLGLSLGYGVSYVISQQTMIYYVLRKKVDGIEINEVFEEVEDEGAPPPAPPEPAKPAEPEKPAEPTASGEKEEPSKAKKVTKSKKVTKRKKS